MGFDLHRLGELEVEFLNALDWKCHVSVDQFSTVLKQLEVELALNQQSKSGLFTYNTARNLDIMGKYLENFLLKKKLIWIEKYFFSCDDRYDETGFKTFYAFGGDFTRIYLCSRFDR